MSALNATHASVATARCLVLSPHPARIALGGLPDFIDPSEWIAGKHILRIKDDPPLIILDEALKRQRVDELNVLVGLEVLQTEHESRW